MSTTGTFAKGKKWTKGAIHRTRVGALGIRVMAVEQGLPECRRTMDTLAASLPRQGPSRVILH
jgi:hypothetical protein